jgi:hypothetical protein
MSEVVDALVVNGELLICIDYDRPIWLNVNNKQNKSLPNHDHFVVDGILGALSSDGLKTLKISNRFNEFDNPSEALNTARAAIYSNPNIRLQYIHYSAGERIIHEDLAKFVATIEVTQLSFADFDKLVKQEN